MSMLTISDQDKTFTYRVAAAIFHGNRVLLHRAETDWFWALPGGRCEMMEPSIDTVRREMAEEIGVEVCVDRLLWIAERFFSLPDRQHHELSFIYLCRLPDSCSLTEPASFTGDEGGLPLIFQWFTVGELEQHEVFPVFLRQGLSQLPERPVHIIARES